ncbi:hypothetical protein ACLOJK_004926 [Asimina triloba]
MELTVRSSKILRDCRRAHSSPDPVEHRQIQQHRRRLLRSQQPLFYSQESQIRFGDSPNLDPASRSAVLDPSPLCRSEIMEAPLNASLDETQIDIKQRPVSESWIDGIHEQQWVSKPNLNSNIVSSPYRSSQQQGLMQWLSPANAIKAEIGPTVGGQHRSSHCNRSSSSKVAHL